MSGTGLLAITSIGPGIGGIDWAIIIVFLAVSTMLAVFTKGRQDGVRDFFLGGRELPWIAVCVSLMATEISAASFLGVPFMAFTGSMVYLQLAIGAILARVLISYFFIPAFYEKVTYSPYQFVGEKLGLGAERMTRGLFVVGAVLGQAVRVFIVALALKLIIGIDETWSIVVILVFAALWALIGGIRTVVWTDVLQFVVIVLAAVLAGAFLISQTHGGLGAILSFARQENKFEFFDFRLDYAVAFTIWTGLFGSTFNTLASHGADQMNTQRLFCCRSISDARKAVLWSALSQVFVVLLVFVGLGLCCYYSQHAEEWTENTYLVGRANVLPIFIATAMPTGLKGLLIIGLLAAAISSVNSALAALSQTTARSLYAREAAAPPSDGASEVKLARIFTIGWAVVLGLLAWYFHSITLFDVVVGTALKTTSFTYGALLGALLLAMLLRKRDGRGILFAAPIAVLAAFGMSMHSMWTHWFVVVGLVLVLTAWLYMLFHEAEQLTEIKDQSEYVRRAWYILLAEFPRTVWVLLGAALVLYVHFGDFYWQAAASAERGIAWPWYLPIGTGITVFLGYLLSRPRPMNTEA